MDLSKLSAVAKAICDATRTAAYRDSYVYTYDGTTVTDIDAISVATCHATWAAVRATTHSF